LTALQRFCAEAPSFACHLPGTDPATDRDGEHYDDDDDDKDDDNEHGGSSPTAISTEGLVAFLAWYRLTRAKDDAGGGPADATRWVSREELARHDGVSAPTIHLSLRGKVYDVTSGAAFYGPGAGYSVLVRFWIQGMLRSR
jgi:hypothetical protein